MRVLIACALHPERVQRLPTALGREFGLELLVDDMTRD